MACVCDGDTTHQLDAVKLGTIIKVIQASKLSTPLGIAIPDTSDTPAKDQVDTNSAHPAITKSEVEDLLQQIAQILRTPSEELITSDHPGIVGSDGLSLPIRAGLKDDQPFQGECHEKDENPIKTTPITSSGLLSPRDASLASTSTGEQCQDHPLSASLTPTVKTQPNETPKDLTVDFGVYKFTQGPTERDFKDSKAPLKFHQTGTSKIAAVDFGAQNLQGAHQSSPGLIFKPFKAGSDQNIFTFRSGSAASPPIKDPSPSRDIPTLAPAYKSHDFNITVGDQHFTFNLSPPQSQATSMRSPLFFSGSLEKRKPAMGTRRESQTPTPGEPAVQKPEALPNRQNLPLRTARRIATEPSSRGKVEGLDELQVLLKKAREGTLLTGEESKVCVAAGYKLSPIPVKLPGQRKKVWFRAWLKSRH